MNYNKPKNSCTAFINSPIVSISLHCFPVFFPYKYFFKTVESQQPLRNLLKNTHILLQSHSVVINNQGLNTDEVHVQVSPTVLILSFGAILFSAPGTLGLDVVCSYCVSRDLNSFSVSFMSFGVQGAAWFLFQSLPVDIWGFPIFHYRKTILWGICFCTPHGAFA